MSFITFTQEATYPYLSTAARKLSFLNSDNISDLVFLKVRGQHIWPDFLNDD